jgi:hypothetical protein
MATPSDGRSTIEYLLSRGRLERIDATTAGAAAVSIIERATRRLLTADGGLEAGDVDGAFSAAYDAYRMAAEAYFVPSSAEISADDSTWALSTARTVVEAVERLLASDPPSLFA